MRASPCGGQGAAGAAVDDEAERGRAGDDGDAGAYGQLPGAGGDVPGDLVLEVGEPFRPVDQGLGALGVEAVHVHVQPERRGVRVQLQRPERRHVDLAAAGEGGAQGHVGVHGADRRTDGAHGEQSQPGPQHDHGEHAEGAEVRAAGGARQVAGGRGAGAGAGLRADELAEAVPDAGGCGTERDADHWARMPRYGLRHAGRRRRS